MRKKSIISYFAIFALAICSTFMSVNAQSSDLSQIFDLMSTNDANVTVYNFGMDNISKNSWGYVVRQDGTFPKYSDYEVVAVLWSYSSGGPEKMWFRLVNSEQFDRGKALIEGPGANATGGFSTTAQKGYWYWLQAKREKLAGTVYISGKWTL